MNARKPIRMSTAVFLCSRRLPNTSGRLAVRRVPARLRCLLVFVAVVACALAGASDLGAAVPRRPPRLGQPAPRPPAGPTPAEPVEPAEAEPVEPAEPTEPAEAEAAPTTAPARRFSPEGEPLTTLVFTGTPKLDLVLLKIKSDTGATITPMGTARGQTIPGPMLKDVTVEEALKWIAAQKDWVYYKDGPNEYVLCDRATFETTKLKTQVVQRIIRPQNIAAADAQKAVERMITQNVGSITSDDRTNQVIVTDLLPVVEAIERTIRLLDQKVFLRVFSIKHADPQDVIKILEEYKSPPGRLELVPKMRQIIAEDTYENIQRMEVMVDILDRGPEMRVYDLNNIDVEAQRLTELETYLSEEIITEGAYLKFDPQNGVMILIDLPTVHEKVQKILDAVDRPARQVYIQAEIVMTSFKHSFELGIDYTFADDLLVQAPTVSTGGGTPTVPGGTTTGQGTYPGGTGTGLVPLQPAQDTTTQLGFTDVAAAAKAIHERYPVFTGGSTGIALDYLSRHARISFNAVMSDTETRVLAQPRLLVKNRQLATIDDGGTIAYATTAYYGGGYGGYGGYGAYGP